MKHHLGSKPSLLNDHMRFLVAHSSENNKWVLLPMGIDDFLPYGGHSTLLGLEGVFSAFSGVFELFWRLWRPKLCF